MNRSRLLVPLAALALAAACNSSAPQEPAPQYQILNRPMYGGTPDLSDAHKAVIALRFEGEFLCSGTLIAKRVVLTAGHCLDSRTASKYQVGFGNDSETAGKMVWKKVAAVQRHPKYDGDKIVNDIGLVRLAEDPPSDVIPIPYLPPSLALDQSDVGEVVEFSGFGQTETGDYGLKLKASDALVLICDGTSECSWQGNRASPLTICYDQNHEGETAGPCSGDSGGPGFVIRDGKEYVAGVTSYGDWNCNAWGCSTKVDRFADFIETFVNPLPDGSACTNGGACQSGFCSDGVCCNTACSSGVCDACSKAAGAAQDGVCQNLNRTCTDYSACTQDDRCVDGKCVGTPFSCPPPNQCQIAPSCYANNKGEPACAYPTKPVGTACDDGDLCTESDGCLNGTCAGKAKVCPEPNACQKPGACDKSSGQCVFENLPDGTACGEGKECDTGVCEDSCGCSSAGAAAPPALGLLAALAMLRRRSRR